ncbi:MAG: hypothetical protein Sapg2KO_43460 [Saprospiraceae bacterium]
MKSKTVLFAVGGILAISFLLAVRSVPPATPENCKPVEGIVEAIYSPCCLDVSIKLKGDGHQYHINRGLDHQEIDLEQLQSQILEKEVELQIIQKRWSPLDPTYNLAPVVAIKIQGQTVFSRLQ